VAADRARVWGVEADRDALRSRLTEAEQLLAEMPSLRASREELEAIRGSFAWRVTGPFRRLAEAVQRDALPDTRLVVKRGLLRLAARVRGGPRG
jgi:plasmid stabilization system protein ParE